jgi:hypothetical protein
MILDEAWEFVPKQHCETPVPISKRPEFVLDVLQLRGAHLASQEQDAAAALNRKL